MISSVLRDEPPSITELKADLPNHLDRIIRRCLEKERARRLPSARELQIELEDLREEVAAESGKHRRELAEQARQREEVARTEATLACHPTVAGWSTIRTKVGISRLTPLTCRSSATSLRSLRALG